MKLAKSILCGVSAIGLAVGSAFANEASDRAAPGIDSTTSSANELTLESSTGSSMPSYEPTQAPEDTVAFAVSEPMELSYVEVYDIDEDRDGVADGQLFLERSDTFVMLAPIEPASPSEHGLEEPSGG